MAVERVAQAAESLGTEKVVRKDWKAVVEGMAQARWVPEEVGARPLEILMGEAKVAKVQSWKRGSRSCLTVEAASWKVKVRLPRDSGHQRVGEHDDLGKNPSC